MKRFLLCACLPVVLLTSCGRPAPVPHRTTPAVQLIATAVQTALPAPATAPARGEAIRFALVGEPVETNAWALFDESGAGYAPRALHAGEYPSLYRLSDPGREFEPYIAGEMPSGVTQEGEYLTATVKLREGLVWSDGSPLTARDAVFTVNRALQFHLGLDWASAYDPELLERAEALDDLTVKFLFKEPFDVGDWQYGALQGPVLSEAYWSPKLAEAEALLPADELTADLEKLEAEAVTLQERIAADNALLLTLPPGLEEYGAASERVRRNQNELNSVNFRLGKLKDQQAAALEAARTVLFALEEAGEPTFGPFLPAVEDGDGWVRSLNPRYPFQKPNYDRAGYFSFADVSSALVALQAGEVDEVLALEGVPAEAATQSSPTSSMRFLAFNPGRAELASPALRMAIACLRGFRETGGEGERDPGVFVTGGPWQNRAALPPCDGMSDDLKIETAVRIMSEAGYSWSRRPDRAQVGTGLLMPGGAPFPALTLLSPPADDDPARARSAGWLESQANTLGIPLTVQWTDPESLRYSVYSSGDYDLAILGWRLGAYPGYLCEWFQPLGAFALDDERLASACARMDTTADLETSRQAALEIQAILMEKLPMVPLYQVMRYEAARNVVYPFDSPLDGFSGMYGAPWLAVPAQ